MSNQFITEFTLTDASKKFLAMEPTLIKDMSDYIGVKLYEHPLLGDTCDLIAIINCGDNKRRLYLTSIKNEYYDNYELFHEVINFMRECDVWQTDPSYYTQQ